MSVPGSKKIATFALRYRFFSPVALIVLSSAFVFAVASSIISACLSLEVDPTPYISLGIPAYLAAFFPLAIGVSLVVDEMWALFGIYNFYGYDGRPLREFVQSLTQQ